VASAVLATEAARGRKKGVWITQAFLPAQPRMIPSRNARAGMIGTPGDSAGAKGRSYPTNRNPTMRNLWGRLSSEPSCLPQRPIGLCLTRSESERTCSSACLRWSAQNVPPRTPRAWLRHSPIQIH